MKFLDHFFGPPSEAAFAKILIEALHRAGNDQQYDYDEAGRRLMVSKGGADVGVLNLSNLHSIFCRLAKQDRSDWLKKTCIGLLNRVEIPADFEDAKPDLRPTIRSRSFLDSVRLGAEADGTTYVEFPSIRVSEHLMACLVYDLPQAIRFVNLENLDTWGVSLYEAMEVARQNLNELPSACASVGGKLYIFENGDACDATRMLRLDMVRQLKVEGSAIALPMTRDCLMIAGSDDLEGLRMMCELADQRQGPRPLCFIAHALVADEWEPWLPPTDNPYHEKFRLLEMKHYGIEYGEQKNPLEKWAAHKGLDVFVGSFSRMRRDDKDLSYSLWSKGVPSWLPKTDLVAFFDKEADVKGLVPWDRVVAEMGDSMEPLDYYPPRWSVEQFPTNEQLQKMGVERW